MKIEEVLVINFSGFGFWDRVASMPNEQLIHCNMRLKLSYKEYRELLNKDSSNLDKEDKDESPT